METVWKRAGGRRHYNAVRQFRRVKRQLDVADMLFAMRRTRQTKPGQMVPWGTQKEIARRLGVCEGTVSRDLKGMLRAHLYPGLPAAKEMALAQGDRAAIVRAVEAIACRRDLPTELSLEATGLLVAMHSLDCMGDRLNHRQWREQTHSICHRAYKLFVKTLTENETREVFRQIMQAKGRRGKRVLAKSHRGPDTHAELPQKTTHILAHHFEDQ